MAGYSDTPCMHRIGIPGRDGVVGDEAVTATGDAVLGPVTANDAILSDDAAVAHADATKIAGDETIDHAAGGRRAKGDGDAAVIKHGHSRDGVAGARKGGADRDTCEIRHGSVEHGQI